MKLARNVGAAASATILAVDLLAEVRRATHSHKRSSAELGDTEEPEDPNAESPSKATATRRRRPEDGSAKATRAKKVAAPG
jgi:hypothetical protein